MLTINKIAENIYNYCRLAMDYDLDGLIFNPSSLISAITEQKELLKSISENDFNILKAILDAKVLNLLEKNRFISQEKIDENDVIANWKTRDALEEMQEAEKFIIFINEELNYRYFKSIIE